MHRHYFYNIYFCNFKIKYFIAILGVFLKLFMYWVRFWCWELARFHCICYSDMSWFTNGPYKLCIKSAPYLHQKSFNWALLHFWCFGTDVAHQLTSLEDAISTRMFLIMVLNVFKKASEKVHCLRHYRKVVKIRWQKSVGTKNHKCLIGWEGEGPFSYTLM